MPGPGITYPQTQPTWGSLIGNPMYDMTAGLFNAPGYENLPRSPTIDMWGGGIDPGVIAAYNQAYWTNPANHAGETIPTNPPKPWVTPAPANKKVGTLGAGVQQTPPPASGGSLPYTAIPSPTVANTLPQFNPAYGRADYGTGAITGTGLPPTTQPAPTTPGALPGTNLGLSTGGVNPYLTDPLMASYYGMQNPNFQQSQQDFYGDPELYSAPSVGRATGGG